MDAPHLPRNLTPAQQQELRVIMAGVEADNHRQVSELMAMVHPDRRAAVMKVGVELVELGARLTSALVDDLPE